MTFETRLLYDNREWSQPELLGGGGEDGSVGVKPPENTVGLRGPMERWVLPSGAQQRLQWGIPKPFSLWPSDLRCRLCRISLPSSWQGFMVSKYSTYWATSRREIEKKLWKCLMLGTKLKASHIRLAPCHCSTPSGWKLGLKLKLHLMGLGEH